MGFNGWKMNGFQWPTERHPRPLETTGVVVDLFGEMGGWSQIAPKYGS